MANDIPLQKSSPILSKISSLLNKPANERSRLIKIHTRRTVLRLFNYRPFFGNMYLSYQPDSQAVSNAWPEFDKLFRGFTRHNKVNNSGDIPRLWSFILNIS